MIKLENLTKDYINGKNCTHALRGIDLNIDECSFTAIVGTSGSGKSTLLNILGGMDMATDGKYYFYDQLVSEYNHTRLQRFRKENISFVFQNFALMNKYSVYENVEMPLLARRVRNRKKIVFDCLEQVGIADLAKKLPTQISGGQQQRCAIARALAADTPLLLADEPTGALDKNTGKDIINCFKEVHSKGKTIILITHDMDVAGECENIIRIEDGLIC